MDVKRIFKTIGVLAVVLLFFLVVGYHCPIEKIFGIPCPGCNMTTSLYYLVKGEIKASIYYHLMLIPSIICLFLGLLFYFQKDNKKWMVVVWAWIILMMIYYVYRMIAIFPEYPMQYNWNSVVGRLLMNLG